MLIEKYNKVLVPTNLKSIQRLISQIEAMAAISTDINEYDNGEGFNSPHSKFYFYEGGNSITYNKTVPIEDIIEWLNILNTYKNTQISGYDDYSAAEKLYDASKQMDDLDNTIGGLVKSAGVKIHGII